MQLEDAIIIQTRFRETKIYIGCMCHEYKNTYMQNPDFNLEK